MRLALGPSREPEPDLFLKSFCGSKMRYLPSLAVGTLALLSLSPLVAQEKVLTNAKRIHSRPTWSPDGKILAYKGDQTLYFQQLAIPNSEKKAFSLSQAFDYWWDKGGSTWTVYSGEKIHRYDSTGKSTLLADLKGKGVRDLHARSKDGSKFYGIRTQKLLDILFEVDLKTGKTKDLVTKLFGVSRVDLDSSGTWLLIGSKPSTFRWEVQVVKIDGSGLVSLFGGGRAQMAEQPQWLDAGKSFVFSSVDGSHGWHLRSYTIATKKELVLTGKQRFRKAAPTMSADGRWMALPELPSLSGTSRLLLFPRDGGGDLILTQPHYAIEDQIAFSPDGKQIAFVGSDKIGGKPQVRVVTVDRPFRLSPALRVGGSASFQLDLFGNEIGLVYLGLGLAAKPLPITGFTGTFSLDFGKGIFFLASSLAPAVKGPFLVPNNTSLAGQEVYLQALRMQIGKFKGSMPSPLYLSIL